MESKENKILQFQAWNQIINPRNFNPRVKNISLQALFPEKARPSQKIEKISRLQWTLLPLNRRMRQMQASLDTGISMARKFILCW